MIGPNPHPPASAIAPLRNRLEVLKAQQRATPNDQRLSTAIAETEALIKNLENPHAPRHP